MLELLKAKDEIIILRTTNNIDINYLPNFENIL